MSDIISQLLLEWKKENNFLLANELIVYMGRKPDYWLHQKHFSTALSENIISPISITVLDQTLMEFFGKRRINVWLDISYNSIVVDRTYNCEYGHFDYFSPREGYSKEEKKIIARKTLLTKRESLEYLNIDEKKWRKIAKPDAYDHRPASNGFRYNLYRYIDIVKLKAHLYREKGVD